jgi:hypothetical protein
MKSVASVICEAVRTVAALPALALGLAREEAGEREAGGASREAAEVAEEGLLEPRRRGRRGRGAALSERLRAGVGREEEVDGAPRRERGRGVHAHGRGARERGACELGACEALTAAGCGSPKSMAQQGSHLEPRTRARCFMNLKSGGRASFSLVLDIVDPP